MVEHVRSGGDHGFERAVLAQEVRSQNFDRGLGRHRTDCGDRLGEMLGAAVVKIVAIDGCHDDVLEFEVRNGFCNSSRRRLHPTSKAGRRDIAERAGTCANAAHDHHGRMPLLPAVADVRAGGLFADGMKLVFTTMARVWS